jgi:hypothetical protein
MKACEKGHIDCIKLLLNNNVSSMHKSIPQEALDTLIRFDHIDIITILLDRDDIDFFQHLDIISTNKDVMCRVIRHKSVQSKLLPKKYKFFNDIAFKHYVKDKKLLKKTQQENINKELMNTNINVTMLRKYSTLIKNLQLHDFTLNNP